MRPGKPGRNDPCPCGSGKKFKKCHVVEVVPQPQRALTASVEERNEIFLDAITDIFGLDKANSWEDVKRRVTPDRVVALYNAHNFIWHADVGDLLPAPSSELTSLFLGHIDPEDLAQRIFRFGLYTDRILVLNPFTFPAPRGKHPLETPTAYVRDTLRLVYFIARMEPWIRAGYVTLIGDPMAYNPAFRSESMRKALARGKALGGIDPRDIEDGKAAMMTEMRRVMCSMPRASMEAHVRRDHPDWTDAERAELVEDMIKLNADDPLAIMPSEERPPPSEMLLTRQGTTLEAALLICQATGAFPYTDTHTKWRELLSASASFPEESRVWSPLTNAFQDLDFHFLNNVDATFAKRLREEERLMGFRIFLRDLWTKAGGSPDPNRAEALAREFRERLTEEHRKAEEEWKKIDRDTASTQAAGLVGLLGTGALTIAGGFGLQAGILSAVVGSVAGLSGVARATSKRKEFRVSTPMSVFVDLKRHRAHDRFK